VTYISSVSGVLQEEERQTNWAMLPHASIYCPAKLEGTDLPEFISPTLLPDI
jgi:hypothetical protein